MLVRPQAEFDLNRSKEWELSETGIAYILQCGRRFVDQRHTWGRYWPYRSTLIKQCGPSEWELVELSVGNKELDDCTALIPECVVGQDWEMLTIMAVFSHELSYVGTVSDKQSLGDIAELLEVKG